MIKLKEPVFSLEQTLKFCEAGIKSKNLKNKINKEKHLLYNYETAYKAIGETAKFYTFEPLEHKKNEDPLIAGSWVKSDLIKLYNNHLSNPKKSARAIYDKIMNTAKDKCPFCGGIGNPKTLDHYLPKAKFPQFSILPLNLIPSCMDCNIGDKGQDHPQTFEEQTIHPYLDQSFFFEDQWIFAKYINLNNDRAGYFEYFPKPPNSWDEPSKIRAITHFNKFHIAERYAKQAAEDSVVYLPSLENNPNLINEFIESSRNSLFINHWKPVMLQALNEYLK